MKSSFYNAKTFCTGRCASDANSTPVDRRLSHIGRGRDNDLAQTVDMIKKNCEFVYISFAVF